MHNSWFFNYFFQKSLSTENYFLIAAINLATRVHCILVLFFLKLSKTIKLYFYLTTIDIDISRGLT